MVSENTKKAEKENLESKIGSLEEKNKQLLGRLERLEKIALGFCVATLVSLTWFWAVQVGWVIETLQMAYG